MDAQAKMENIGGKAVCVCRDFKTGNIKIE